MKNIFTIIFVTGIICLSANISFSQTAPQYIADSLQAILNKSLPAGTQNPGAVMGVHVPGQWSWYGAAGKSIAGVTNGYPATAANPTDKFRAGSITKTFVAAAILQLEENGLLGIDDNISLYVRPSLLNDTIKGSAPITIKQLLNHTSGIANAADNDSCRQDALNNLTRTYSLEEAVYCGASQGENFPAGFAWSYSNTNYTILAMIIEGVTGKTFEAYITDSIITPLGLANTEIPATDEINGAHLGCYWNIGVLLDMTIVDQTMYKGWANIVSTTEDLNTFYTALRNGSVISPASFVKMKEIVPVSIDYGLGLDFYTISGDSYYGHSGEVGNTSGMFFANISTSAFPEGYYISYNYNYQGVDIMTVMDKPVFNLLKNYTPSSIGEAKTPAISFNIFPNPASGKLNITFNTIITSGTLEIIDIEGRSLKQVSLDTYSGSKSFSIAVGDLDNGLYFIKILNNNESVIKKLCISK